MWAIAQRTFSKISRQNLNSKMFDSAKNLKMLCKSEKWIFHSVTEIWHKSLCWNHHKIQLQRGPLLFVELPWNENILTNASFIFKHKNHFPSIDEVVLSHQNENPYRELTLPLVDEFPLKLSSDDNKWRSKCASNVAVSSKNELKSK